MDRCPDADHSPGFKQEGKCSHSLSPNHLLRPKYIQVASKARAKWNDRTPRVIL
jgi:hypothetical protein